MAKLFDALEEQIVNGQSAVLLSIYKSTGSAPRGAGAHMLVTEAGRVFGTVGGGAVEYESELFAHRLLKEKKSVCEHYRLAPNDVWDLGMVCGADVDISFTYVDADEKQWQEMAEGCRAMEAARESVWLLIGLNGIHEGEAAVYGKKTGQIGWKIPETVIEEMRTAFGTVEADGTIYYYERLHSSGKVYIFGGGHVAQALVPILTSVDFSCVILENREEFCRPELFPGAEDVRMIENWHLGDYVSIGEEDYVCVMTRGHKDDTIVQEQILRTPAAYIGVIGSRRKKASVFRVLKEDGFTDRDLERITTPIGLEIGAETPAEIAISIAAQMIEVRAKVRK